MTQTPIEIYEDGFNHCSTIHPYQDGVLIAWYSGSTECSDDQSVYIVFINHDTHSEINRSPTRIRIGDKTGNPVLWQNGQDIYILWSKFEDDDTMFSLADRWKYCSIWVQKIDVCDNQILLSKPERIAASNQHLLGRCSVLTFNNTTILPLYDELAGTCVLVDGTTFKELSRFGVGMIQPTLWTKRNKVHALARNFRSTNKKAQYVCSSDINNWSQPVDTNIYNVNNSLCVVSWGRSEIIIWNNGLSRARLTLGLLNKDYSNLSAFPIIVVGVSYGAYPSCTIINNQLHLTFTNYKRRIEYRVYKQSDIRKAYRNSIRFRKPRKGSNSITEKTETEFL